MFPYIYTERNNIHILDLVQSAQLLKEANTYVESESKKNKIFLFVGTKRQASSLIAQEAKRCDSYYVNHRWLGGMLTNWVTLKSRIERLKTLEQEEVDQVFDLLPKKEAALLRREHDKPPIFWRSLSCSRRKRAASFFGNKSKIPSSAFLSNSFKYSIRF
jgi:small subunit ribosomal protein S2